MVRCFAPYRGSVEAPAPACGGVNASERRDAPAAAMDAKRDRRSQPGGSPAATGQATRNGPRGGVRGRVQCRYRAPSGLTIGPVAFEAPVLSAWGRWGKAMLPVILGQPEQAPPWDRVRQP